MTFVLGSRVIYCNTVYFYEGDSETAGWIHLRKPGKDGRWLARAIDCRPATAKWMWLAEPSTVKSRPFLALVGNPSTGWTMNFGHTAGVMNGQDMLPLLPALPEFYLVMTEKRLDEEVHQALREAAPTKDEFLAIHWIDDPRFIQQLNQYRMNSEYWIRCLEFLEREGKWKNYHPLVPIGEHLNVWCIESLLPAHVVAMANGIGDHIPSNIEL